LSYPPLDTGGSKRGGRQRGRGIPRAGIIEGATALGRSFHPRRRIDETERESLSLSYYERSNFALPRKETQSVSSVKRKGEYVKVAAFAFASRFGGCPIEF